MAILEGAWDCDTCGHTNRGTATQCASCSGPRDTEQFYLPVDAPEVTDAAALAEANAGAAWNCDHCGCDNGPLKQACEQCGHPRDGDDQVRQTRRYAVGQVPRSAEAAVFRPDTQPSFPQEHGPARTSARSQLALGAVVVGTLFLLLWLLWPRSISATVQGHSWKRVLEVQRYVTKTDEGWTVPDGGRVLSSREKTHHHETVVVDTVTKTRKKTVGTGRYKDVPDGYENLANGNFKEKFKKVEIMKEVDEEYEEDVTAQVPVKRTWYTYAYDIWEHERDLVTQGNDRQPYWHAFTAAGPKQRSRKKSAVYTVTFLRDDGTGTVPKNYDDERVWLSFSEGDPVILKMNAAGSLYDVLKE